MKGKFLQEKSYIKIFFRFGLPLRHIGAPSPTDQSRVRSICACVSQQAPTLIDMANDRQRTAKESKGFYNRLKKTFRLGSQSTPQSRSPSAAPVDAAPPPAIDPVEAAKLRARYTHFRILIVGRANAGKTTLLQRVCNTKEDPVYDKVRYQPCLIP